MKATPADVRACRRKIVYPSRGVAEVHRRRQRMHGRLNSYRCPCCGMWHIGTKPDPYWRLIKAIQKGFGGRE